MLHFDSCTLAFLCHCLFFSQFSGLKKVKLKEKLNIRKNLLRLMFIKIGPKKAVIKNKSHQRRAADDSSCEMAAHGGNQ